MRFKFVHAADLHLDTPFRGVPVDSGLLSTFQQATFRAFSRVVDLCLRERVDFLVLAGDLFDTKDRSVRARLVLRRELERLAAGGIQTFLVHGNHDPLSGDTGTLALPGAVKVFGAEWEEVEVRREGRLLCRVQGISYPEAEVRENLSARFRRTAPDFTVGLLHANVGGSEGHANYAPCSVEDLTARGLDYWALGHVHTRTEYPLASGAVAVYPGNPQGRHVHEPGERGCVLVEVEDGRTRRRFVPVDRVRWHRWELPLTGLGTLETLVGAVEERVDAECSAALEGHAVRLTLTGQGPLHRELSAPESLRQLEAELREQLAARPTPVLLESLRDASRSELDLETVRRAGGFSGTLLSEAEAVMADADELTALWDGDEELRTLAHRLRRLDMPTLMTPRPEWVEQAGWRVVRELHEEDAA